MTEMPPSISSRLASDRLRRSVTSVSSASWCLASRSLHGVGAFSASWRSDGFAGRPSRTAKPPGGGQRLGGGSALHLEVAQLVEDDLDLVRDPGQPAGLAREDQVLLLLGLEQQQVQQLLLAPEQRRHVLVVHVLHRLPRVAVSTGASAPERSASSRNADTAG